MEWSFEVIKKDRKIDSHFPSSSFLCMNHCPRPFSMAFFIFMLAFVMWGIACVERAGSHPGIAPEVDEITHELEKNPNSVDLGGRRIIKKRSNNDLIKSLHDLDQAEQLESGNSEILFQRGLTLSALGRDVEAEVALDQFLEKVALAKNGSVIPSSHGAKKSAIAMAERARIRARTGRTDLAITDYTSAIHMLPVVESYQARGHLLESLGKLAEAALGYREGLSKMPNAILLKKSLIRVEIARKQFTQALLLIDEELARASVKSSWYLRRGDVLAAMGQPDAARAAREQALAEVNQTMTKRVTAIHRFSRAKVYMALGRVEEAKRDLQLAIQMAPNFAGARDLLRKLGAS
jgi:tetratricopeptide (TPR) repeat protein